MCVNDNWNMSKLSLKTININNRAVNATLIFYIVYFSEEKKKIFYSDCLSDTAVTELDFYTWSGLVVAKANSGGP